MADGKGYSRHAVAFVSSPQTEARSAKKQAWEPEESQNCKFLQKKLCQFEKYV